MCFFFASYILRGRDVSVAVATATVHEAQQAKVFLVAPEGHAGDVVLIRAIVAAPRMSPPSPASTGPSFVAMGPLLLPFSTYKHPSLSERAKQTKWWGASYADGSSL